MRIKLDENLPWQLIEGLASLGHDVDTVLQERLGGRPDAEVWIAAQQNQRFLITQDLDFSDLRKYEPGSHCGVLLVRLRRPGRAALTRRILQVFSDEADESWARCFIVSTETKSRVRRPKPPPNMSIETS